MWVSNFTLVSEYKPRWDDGGEVDYWGEMTAQRCVFEWCKSKEEGEKCVYLNVLFK